MQINMTCDEARRFAALAKASSRDPSRPILQGIHFEWRSDGESLQLTAVATDSYILAGRELTVPAGDYTAGDGDDTGEITVPAKLFAEAVNTIVKTQGKRPGAQLILNVTGEGLTVSGGSNDSPQFPLTPLAGTFPKWRQLFEGQRRRHTGTLPAFAPDLFSRLLSASSPTAASLRKAGPIRLTVGDGARRPYGFVRHDADTSTFKGLIMPVTVD